MLHFPQITISLFVCIKSKAVISFFQERACRKSLPLADHIGSGNPLARINLSFRSMVNAVSWFLGLYMNTFLWYLHFYKYCVYWKHTGGVNVRFFLEMPIL